MTSPSKALWQRTRQGLAALLGGFAICSGPALATSPTAARPPVAPVTQAPQTPPTPERCEDRGALERPAVTTESSVLYDCDGGLEVLWVHLSWDGTQCAAWIQSEPAHQKCSPDGPVMPGFECEPEGNLPVQLKTCACDESNILGGLLGVLNECECSEWMVVGEVEDCRTVPCRIGT